MTMSRILGDTGRGGGNTLKKLLAASLLVLSSVAQAVEYNVAVLGSLGGDSRAFGMNDSGQVVGTSYNSSTARVEAVIWNNGIVQSLGVEGIARAVNNSGTVVGETGTNAANNWFGYGRAFKWDSANGYADLGDLGGPAAGAFDINDSGVIIGSSFVSSETTALLRSRGFRWESGVMTDLGTVSSPTGYSRANSINESGIISGRGSIVDFTDSDKHLVTWDAANNLTQTVGPYNYSDGGDINNLGVIVGNSKDANGKHRATIWNGTSVLQLGTLGGDDSYFRAINDAGIAVGKAEYLPGNNASRAIVSFDGVSIVDLNTLVDLTGTGFASLDEAWDINANGDIVGYGTLTGGGQGAFVISAVPVPAAVWLFGSALAALGWRKRRQG